MVQTNKSTSIMVQTKAEFISYLQTGYFPKIVTDYLSQNSLLRDFYQHAPNLDGIRSAIEKRKNFSTNRSVLVQQLHQQYSSIEISEKVKKNIDALLNENTFTICTAHQPNIFTGHLYFIYKIVNTIKLADELNKQLPVNNFVPVFYVGSEDADLEELGEVTVNGVKYKWQTRQKGAVGRMIVDDELLTIIKKIKGQLSVEKFGNEVIELIEQCYVQGRSLQQACFSLVNQLFQQYGLIVLLPDNTELKRMMLPVFKDDLYFNTASKIVAGTTNKLSENYKVQAHPREINLFYLVDNIRNRIVLENETYKVHDSEIKFSKEQIEEELNTYPERFSPNVILRSLYQETILPNIVFIGGGGELAYWLEVKDIFDNYKVPYPVLILRNSFLFIRDKYNSLMEKLSLTNADIFHPEETLIKNIVTNNSSQQLTLEKEKQQLLLIYADLKKAAKNVDGSLEAHVESLQAQHLKKLDQLEAKLLRAEKKKFEAEQKQLNKIKATLFPGNTLQERVENFMPFYARWGKDFINVIYDNSLSFEQEFCIINEKDPPA